MKRSKLLVLTTAALALLMLFTACGKSGGNLLKDAFLDDASYTDFNPSYTVSEKISDLTEASVSTYMGELVLLTKNDPDEPLKTKYYVYNVATGSIVWSDTQTATYSVDVDLDYVEYYYSDCSYFVVKTVTNGEEEGAKPVTTTILYNAAGEQVVSVNRSVSVENVSDLLYVDGKMYRANQEGKIAYAFDYSPLASIPDVYTKYNGQYYELEEEYVTVYDNELNFVSKYRLPVHVSEDGEVTAFVVLENGNVLLQYVYVADSHSDEYDLIVSEGDEQIKYMVVTQIVNAKKGSVKEIKCEYLFEDLTNIIERAELAKEAGIDAEKIPVFGYAYRIDDKKLGDTLSVVVDNNGKCKEMGALNGDPIQNFMLFADGCWVVSTESAEFLVDKDGKIIGDVSNARQFGKFMYAEGKIYDAALNVIYNYAENNLDFKSVVGDSLLFEDNDGRLLLYTGSGDPITLIDKDSQKTLSKVSDSWEGAGYIVIKSGEQYEVYNDAGTKLGTINDVAPVESSISVVTSTDNAIMIKLLTTDGKNVFYRFA